jgi:ribosomal protein S18 acetylase RimI-like enzyme
VIVTTHLEITDPAALLPAPAVAGIQIGLVHDPAFNRDFYARIGARWSWTDRLPWTEERWAAWSQRVETWKATAAGEPVGYYELDATADGSVEIASFGLLPGFEGRGLGGHLLTHAIRRGFELGPRVWVHTCTLDAPGALPNYLARGMSVVAVEPTA